MRLPTCRASGRKLMLLLDLQRAANQSKDATRKDHAELPGNAMRKAIRCRGCAVAPTDSLRLAVQHNLRIAAFAARKSFRSDGRKTLKRTRAGL
jgi:hypothetical protein